MNRRLRHCTLSLGPALVLALLASVAWAQATLLTPNYRNTDIRQVIEAVGAVTGRNFLVDPRVRAKVTLVTNTPMSVDAFYQAFLATLAVHGYTAVQDGPVTKIIPDANARQVLPPTDAGATGDALVTRIIKVKNVAATQLVPVLRPLMPQYAYLSANQASNMLLLADRASNVKRIVGIVHAMDKAANQDVEVIPIEHASAARIVATLSALSRPQQSKNGGLQAMLVADSRTNSILLSGSEAERLRYRGLIAYLDVPSQTGNTRVRYLDYANAKDLATKLQDQFNVSAAAGDATPAGAPPPVSIWADPNTNALVVSAPGKTMASIMSVVDKLDIPRAQVAVDAIIVELTEKKAAQLGVTWLTKGSSDTPAIGITNFGKTVPGVVQLGAAAAAGTVSPAAVPSGLVLGIGALTGGGTDWAALLTALKGDATTNIISTPHIVTLDNEEATIKVGQKVPFVTGRFTNTNAGGLQNGVVNPFQTIQREDVGTTLKITPQINSGSGVKLKIVQKTSSVSSSAEGAVDLVTNNRSIETTVFVKDGQILVLGGLMDNKLMQNDQRVPFLGRIPGLGWLFRAHKTQRVKTNLMVFIRPTILRNNIQTRFLTNSKYNYMRSLQLQRAKEPVTLMRNETTPVLPPLKSGADTADSGSNSPDTSPSATNDPASAQQGHDH